MTSAEIELKLASVRRQIDKFKAREHDLLEQRDAALSRELAAHYGITIDKIEVNNDSSRHRFRRWLISNGTDKQFVSHNGHVYFSKAFIANECGFDSVCRLSDVSGYELSEHSCES